MGESRSSSRIRRTYSSCDSRPVRISSNTASAAPSAFDNCGRAAGRASIGSSRRASSASERLGRAPRARGACLSLRPPCTHSYTGRALSRNSRDSQAQASPRSAGGQSAAPRRLPVHQRARRAFSISLSLPLHLDAAAAPRILGHRAFSEHRSEIRGSWLCARDRLEAARLKRGGGR